ncbi:MAG: SDR family oxidoreductase [Sphingomonadales bacterium]|nr:SDR family oxidoreductase [Sphingomonadales bacterium]
MALAIDLGGKLILVCGSGRGGISGATARQIARAGGSLVVLDKDPALLAEVVEDVTALGGSIETMLVDLADEAQVEAVIPAIVARHGRIDGLANVAGGTREDEWLPLDETPTESFRQTLAINLDYVFMLCRDAARAMIASGTRGSLVNVGSVSAIAAAPWHGPYGAGKSAIGALTRTMANEWHEFGIRANTVSPGGVMSKRVAERRQAANVVPGAMADEDFALPVELANMITFLLSDLASGVSGQTIFVDRSLSTKFCAGARKSRKEVGSAR